MTADQEVCRAYAWIGQSFKYCDHCGHPYWEHTHTYKLGSGRPFGSEPDERCRITCKFCEAVCRCAVCDHTSGSGS